MRTLALRNGDLVLGQGGYAVVEGREKLRQDLSVLMREPFGSDPLHPRWGSLLTEYIGRPISDETAMLVRGEITRLLSNYGLVQAGLVAEDRSANRRPRFTTGEIIGQVLGIDVRQQWDRYRVRVSVKTLSGEQVTLIQSVEP
jgi:hypothetical protein